MGVEVQSVSGVYDFAADDAEWGAVVDDDCRQCVHVMARWHLDEVRAAANGPRPAPVFEVVLVADHWPAHVDWTFDRFPDLAALAPRHDLAWWAREAMGRPEFAEDAFAPPPGHVTVIHFDAAWRAAAGYTKLAIFTVPIDAVERHAARLAALSPAERTLRPGRAHYGWRITE